MASEVEIYTILADLTACYPSAKAADATLERYAYHLRDIPATVLRAACERLAVAARYFPSLAEIREMATIISPPQTALQCFFGHDGQGVMPVALGDDEVLLPCAYCQPAAYQAELRRARRERAARGLSVESVPPAVREALQRVMARHALTLAGVAPTLPAAERKALWCSRCGERSNTRWGTQPGNVHGLPTLLPDGTTASYCGGIWGTTRAVPEVAEVAA